MTAALRRHLAGGKVRVPEAGRLVWQWYSMLHASRTMSFAGPNAISYAEIHAWAALQRWPVREDHIALIRALDEAFLAHVFANKGGDKNAIPRSSGQKVTPAAFDAVFK
jgi:hypothetical protein